ncbi:hypothetical protein KUTeg_014236 [Tegillarca granosa]|uniref:DDE Tnp4 domain-containing protein n=1 Tax=Tegillarca granosa TaxID=220873 RepID=A0ABQ9EZI0_TEGGR|nr:hypothetical protein KUTeg_014236 [Tegillarca granosa]
MSRMIQVSIDIENVNARFPGLYFDGKKVMLIKIPVGKKSEKTTSVVKNQYNQAKGQRAREERFNYALCNARVKIENVFGVLKRRFRCLRHQLRLKLRATLAVIIACAVLYNIARKMSLPLPDDSDGEDEIVPVQAFGNANQGGQARRNLIIRHFR